MEEWHGRTNERGRNPGLYNLLEQTYFQGEALLVSDKLMLTEETPETRKARLYGQGEKSLKWM